MKCCTCKSIMLVKGAKPLTTDEPECLDVDGSTVAKDAVRLAKELGIAQDAYIYVTLYWVSKASYGFSYIADGDPWHDTMNSNDEKSYLEALTNGGGTGSTRDTNRDVGLECVYFKEVIDVEPAVHSFSIGSDVFNPLCKENTFVLIERRKDKDAPLQEYVLLRAKGWDLADMDNALAFLMTVPDDGDEVISKVGVNFDVVESKNFQINT